jgi:hypothetical protein
VAIVVFEMVRSWSSSGVRAESLIGLSAEAELDNEVKEEEEGARTESLREGEAEGSIPASLITLAVFE